MSNPESSIASARASVMVYDDANKKWLPSGTSSGLSRVHIYQHIQNNTFRVVGRKLQDHEVVINCAILKNLKYNQATPIFHQWRENRTVFGLNFSSKEEADAFAHTMMKVIDLLNQNTYGTTKSVQQGPPSQQNNQPVYGHIGPPEEYGEIGRQQQQNGWNGNPNGGLNNQMQPHNNHINGLVDPQHPQQQQQNGGGPPPMHMQANPHNSQMQQLPSQMHQQMMPPEVVQHHQQLQQQNMQQLTQHMTNVTLSQAMLQTQATYMSTGNMMNMHRNSVSNVNNSQQQQQQQQQIQQPANSIPPPPPPPPPMPTNNGQPMMAPNIINNNNGMMNGVAPAGPTGAPPPPPPPPPPGMLNGGGGGPPRMVSNGQTNNIPPAPPMPSMPLGGNSGGPSNLAAALANAKLKRTASGKVDDNDSLSSNSSSGRTSNSTAAAPGNLMDEMAKTLARRRAQAESNQQNDGDSGSVSSGSVGGARNFNGIKSEKSSSLVNGCSPSKDESNSHHRKNGPSEESKFNGGLCEADMDRLKQEIMTDIRKELQKLKLDIIEAVKVELNRR